MENKKEKLLKIELKLKKRHPKKSFRLGKHVVTPELKSFELNESEAKELESKGCQHWIISKQQIEEAKKQKKVPAKKED